MGKNIKDDIKKIANETEVKLTGFLLRWKEKREGKETSDPDAIEQKSRIITDKANEILKRRGKTILKEFKNAYIKKSGQEDSND